MCLSLDNRIAASSLLNILYWLTDKHERFEEMRDWVDNGFSAWYEDRTYVDIEETNRRLERYKEHAKFILGE